jgi:hypothetical protein
MKESKGKVLLSFDVEEFDIPLEYDQQISMDEQLQKGFEGFEVIMNVVDEANIPATLFTTANFASNYSSVMQSLRPHHEVASHTYYHSSFKNEDLLLSRKKLEEICGKPVTGLRMPRMRPVDMKEVKEAGYEYDSSINPTFLPGRYNNFHLPRTIYFEQEMLRLPASVTPVFRIPLFWLSFKNLPYKLFLSWVKRTINNDGYVCLYFHPWEFVDISKYNLPGYVKRHSGKKLTERLVALINDLKKENQFSTIHEFLKNNSKC